MSDSTRPHRQQSTRLHHPWDSPGKNTGVGCHFLLQCMKVKSESEVTQLCLTLHHPMDYSLPGFSVQGIFQARVLEWGAIAFSTKSLQSCPSRFSPPEKPYGLEPSGSSVQGDSPRKNTGMGCHILLQGIFATQGSNPCLLCLL